jgi:hypothetical protein
MKRRPSKPSLVGFRVLFVRESRTTGPHGYELRMHTSHTDVGAFLIPESYDYYADACGSGKDGRRGKDEWLASMHKRFTFVPADKQAGIVTISRDRE